jgi:hypothetical protein
MQMMKAEGFFREELSVKDQKRSDSSRASNCIAFSWGLAAAQVRRAIFDAPCPGVITIKAERLRRFCLFNNKDST